MSVMEIEVTFSEGGSWKKVRVHSVRLPDGVEYDAINGRRPARKEAGKDYVQAFGTPIDLLKDG